MQEPTFPLVAFSTAGWTKACIDLDDLVEASPNDDLREWQQLEVVDGAGHLFRARRTFRAWPRSSVGGWLCRLMNNAIHVGFEWDTPVPITVEEFRCRVEAAHADSERLAGCRTHREMIDLL